MKILNLAVALLISSGILSSVLADEKVTAYYTAELKSSEAVTTALSANGFEVLGRHQVNGDANLEVIFFTSLELLNEAKKEGRGFAGVLRLLVNKNANEIRVQNPLYFLHAIMQKEYSQSTADTIKTKLAAALGELKETADVLKSGELANYRFMFGMPYYDDMIKVGSADYADCIKKKGGIIFKKDIGNATLMAVGMGSEIEGFPKKLNLTENSLVLPYLVVIEKEAKILHPKFFIALSFPRLGMGQFMTISDIPGKIKDQLTCSP